MRDFTLRGVLFDAVEGDDGQPGFSQHLFGALWVPGLFKAGVRDQQRPAATQFTCEFAKSVEATDFDNHPPQGLEIKRRQWVAVRAGTGVPVGGRGA